MSDGTGSTSAGGSHTCNLCNVVLSSFMSYQIHCGSYLHSSKLAAAKKVKNATYSQDGAQNKRNQNPASGQGKEFDMFDPFLGEDDVKSYLKTSKKNKKVAGAAAQVKQQQQKKEPYTGGAQAADSFYGSGNERREGSAQSAGSSYGHASSKRRRDVPFASGNSDTVIDLTDDQNYLNELHDFQSMREHQSAPQSQRGLYYSTKQPPRGQTRQSNRSGTDEMDSAIKNTLLALSSTNQQQPNPTPLMAIPTGAMTLTEEDLVYYFSNSIKAEDTIMQMRPYMDPNKPEPFSLQVGVGCCMVCKTKKTIMQGVVQWFSHVEGKKHEQAIQTLLKTETMPEVKEKFGISAIPQRYLSQFETYQLIQDVFESFSCLFPAHMTKETKGKYCAFIIQAGQTNKHDCRVCRTPTANMPHWILHVLSSPHAKACILELQKLGLRKFREEYGKIPGPNPQNYWPLTKQFPGCLQPGIQGSQSLPSSAYKWNGFEHVDMADPKNTLQPYAKFAKTQRKMVNPKAVPNLGAGLAPQAQPVNPAMAPNRPIGETLQSLASMGQAIPGLGASRPIPPASLGRASTSMGQAIPGLGASRPIAPASLGRASTSMGQAIPGLGAPRPITPESLGMSRHVAAQLAQAQQLIASKAVGSTSLRPNLEGPLAASTLAAAAGAQPNVNILALLQQKVQAEVLNSVQQNTVLLKAFIGALVQKMGTDGKEKQDSDPPSKVVLDYSHGKTDSEKDEHDQVKKKDSSREPPSEFKDDPRTEDMEISGDESEHEDMKKASTAILAAAPWKSQSTRKAKSETTQNSHQVLETIESNPVPTSAKDTSSDKKNSQSLIKWTYKKWSKQDSNSPSEIGPEDSKPQATSQTVNRSVVSSAYTYTDSAYTAATVQGNAYTQTPAVMANTSLTTSYMQQPHVVPQVPVNQAMTPQGAYMPQQVTPVPGVTPSVYQSYQAGYQPQTVYSAPVQMPAMYPGTVQAPNMYSGTAQVQTMDSGTAQGQTMYPGAAQTQTMYSGAAQTQTMYSGAAQTQTMYSGAAQAQTMYSGTAQELTMYSGTAQPQTIYPGTPQTQAMSPAVAKPIKTPKVQKNTTTMLRPRQLKSIPTDATSEPTLAQAKAVQPQTTAGFPHASHQPGQPKSGKASNQRASNPNNTASIVMNQLKQFKNERRSQIKRNPSSGQAATVKAVKGAPWEVAATKSSQVEKDPIVQAAVAKSAMEAPWNVSAKAQVKKDPSRVAAAANPAWKVANANLSQAQRKPTEQDTATNPGWEAANAKLSQVQRNPSGQAATANPAWEAANAKLSQIQKNPNGQATAANPAWKVANANLAQRNPSRQPTAASSNWDVAAANLQQTGYPASAQSTWPSERKGGGKAASGKVQDQEVQKAFAMVDQERNRADNAQRSHGATADNKGERKRRSRFDDGRYSELEVDERGNNLMGRSGSGETGQKSQDDAHRRPDGSFRDDSRSVRSKSTDKHGRTRSTDGNTRSISIDRSRRDHHGDRDFDDNRESKYNRSEGRSRRDNVDTTYDDNVDRRGQRDSNETTDDRSHTRIIRGESSDRRDRRSHSDRGKSRDRNSHADSSERSRKDRSRLRHDDARTDSSHFRGNNDLRNSTKEDEDFCGDRSEPRAGEDGWHRPERHDREDRLSHRRREEVADGYADRYDDRTGDSRRQRRKEGKDTDRTVHQEDIRRDETRRREDDDLYMQQDDDRYSRTEKEDRHRKRRYEDDDEDLYGKRRPDDRHADSYEYSADGDDSLHRRRRHEERHQDGGPEVSGTQEMQARLHLLIRSLGIEDENVAAPLMELATQMDPSSLEQLLNPDFLTAVGQLRQILDGGSDPAMLATLLNSDVMKDEGIYQLLQMLGLDVEALKVLHGQTSVQQEQPYYQDQQRASTGNTRHESRRRRR